MISDAKHTDAFENWHTFFDTCQLPKRFPITNETDREALRVANARMYVPGLVFEERVVQGQNRNKLQKTLAKHAQITPVGGPIDLATKMRFFATKTRVEFKDAAIVLSVIEYASTGVCIRH